MGKCEVLLDEHNIVSGVISNTAHTRAKSKIILKNIKKNERILHPAAWRYQTLTGFWIVFLLGVYIGITNINIALPQEDIQKAMFFIAVFSLGALFSRFRHNKRAFSIRLNAYGMMVTEYSYPTWYSWRTMLDIEIDKNNDSRGIRFKTGIWRKSGILEKVFGLIYTELPKNYNVSNEEMIGLMKRYKRQYNNLELYKYPHLEIEAKKGPPLSSLWKKRSKEKSVN